MKQSSGITTPVMALPRWTLICGQEQWTEGENELKAHAIGEIFDPQSRREGRINVKEMEDVRKSGNGKELVKGRSNISDRLVALSNENANKGD